MKKLLLILLCFPMVGFGQGCQYGSSTDASELCNFYKGNNFATYRNADIALDKILDVTGMSKRFVLKECNDISNCVATAYKGIRYILYDRDFMDAIATRTNSWSSMSILAHEIGHHVNGHSLDLIIYATKSAEAPTLTESHQMELEADEYSGFIMAKLGASLYQAQQAVSLVSNNSDDSYSTHPSKDKRLKAIERGYNKAKSPDSNNDYSNSSLTAEDYFYRAFNNESDWQYQIDNYTKCLRKEPDYSALVYFNRGNTYGELKKWKDALADYARALRIEPDYAEVYTNRGLIYNSLENYNYAIDDFTRAIRIDPVNTYAYIGRGNTYSELKKWKDAIADYTRALRIEPDYANAYYNRGLIYNSLENYNYAIDDFTRALRIDPDYADAYNGRGFSYYVLRNYNDAIDDFTRTLRIDPDNADVYFIRGLAYYGLENYNDAIDDFTRTLRIDPDNADAYISRGGAKLNLELYYCNDFKRACSLGLCDNYNIFCR